MSEQRDGGLQEFYVVMNSFAAPFCSDTGYKYAAARTPVEALEMVADTYSHPAGLYAAQAYSSADAKNKGEKPLAEWLCNHEREKQVMTKDLGCYSFLGYAPGDFEIDGVLHLVNRPKEGYATTTESAS